MSKIGNLLNFYQEFIALPWAKDIAPDQRVIFGIYDPADELKLRASIDNFELATRAVNHDWFAVDLENTFSDWLSSLKYKHKYFQKPEVLSSILERFAVYLTEEIKTQSAEEINNANAVIALYGIGALYGLIKIKTLADTLAPYVAGRLLFFFPGSYENDNYRLLNGYDGWNYRAIVLNK